MTERSLTAQSPAGNFTGRTDDGVTSWRGIRYALAPTGERRWRAPVAAPRVETDVYATEFGPVCPQKQNAGVPMQADAVFDEDCLSLNVWAPQEATGPLPVMVWVHGGAYTFGASSQPLYDATSLVQTGGIMVVTINYRLGGFGFLDLTSVLPDTDNNLALRDVLLALQWVHDNIAAFGGDPERVTVAGSPPVAGWSRPCWRRRRRKASSTGRSPSRRRPPASTGRTDPVLSPSRSSSNAVWRRSTRRPFAQSLRTRS